MIKRNHRRAGALAVLLIALAAHHGCAASRTQEALSPDELRFRQGMLALDAYVQYCADASARLLDDPAALSAEEKAQLRQLWQALHKMSRGLNVAIGNYPPSVQSLESEER